MSGYFSLFILLFRHRHGELALTQLVSVLEMVFVRVCHVLWSVSILDAIESVKKTNYIVD